MTSVLATMRVEELEAHFARHAVPALHASSVLRAFYANDGDLDAQALPPRVRSSLESLGSSAALPFVAARQRSADGTTKLLLRLHDGRSVESVLMPAPSGDRAAGCLSSQVGCAMACDFCATAKMGFERSLEPHEMVAQLFALRREAKAVGRRLATVVFMGMGEPLLNTANVVEAVRRIADNRYGGLGWRQVTVSTVGIVPGIDALAETRLGFHLAVSLHAPDDETRARLLPTGRRYRIADILAAADRFQATRGRPVTIQYCLLGGVNDSDGHADALAAVVGSRRMHVNLLHYNETGTSLRGAAYRPASPEREDAFLARLRDRGIVTHFRRSRGPEIAAACGQLRASANSGSATEFPTSAKFGS